MSPSTLIVTSESEPLKVEMKELNTKLDKKFRKMKERSIKLDGKVDVVARKLDEVLHELRKQTKEL